MRSSVIPHVWSKKAGFYFILHVHWNPEENGAVAERFLREHPDYAAAGLDLPKGWRRGIEEPANQWTLFPCLNGPDGFFYGCLPQKLEGAEFNFILIIV